MTTRELALNVLLEVNEKEAFLNKMLSDVLQAHQYMEKQDRAFLSRLCEGSVERRLELDYIINHVSKVKVKKMKPVIRNILRMGVYQLLYMDIVPDSAACNESVKLAVKKGFGSLRGFVNGVLRTVAREKGSIPYPDKNTEPNAWLSIAYSMPEWIVDRYVEQFGSQTAEKIVKAYLEPKVTTIRTNTIKGNTDELKKQLEQEQVTVRPGTYFPYALKISGYNYIGGLASFQEGWFQVQDESSMLAAACAGMKKESTVLDVCAAPGGKSTHFAQLLYPGGKVVARDLTESKVALIQENADRLGLSNLVPQCMDALCSYEEDIQKADVVVADLPCSGLGVIGKKTDIKYRVSEEEISKLARLQRDILSVVKDYVKPGGILLYSTCTITKEENEENAVWFAKENPEFTAESIEEYLPEPLRKDAGKNSIQVIPGVHECDGFFLAKFRKKDVR